MQGQLISVNLLGQQRKSVVRQSVEGPIHSEVGLLYVCFFVCVREREKERELRGESRKGVYD